MRSTRARPVKGSPVKICRGGDCLSPAVGCGGCPRRGRQDQTDMVRDAWGAEGDAKGAATCSGAGQGAAGDHSEPYQQRVQSGGAAIPATCREHPSTKSTLHRRGDPPALVSEAREFLQQTAQGQRLIARIDATPLQRTHRRQAAVVPEDRLTRAATFDNSVRHFARATAYGVSHAHSAHLQGVSLPPQIQLRWPLPQSDHGKAQSMGPLSDCHATPFPVAKRPAQSSSPEPAAPVQVETSRCSASPGPLHTPPNR